MTTISNIPASVEWRVYKGDTAQISIFAFNEDGTELDLTDYTCTGQIRLNPSASEPFTLLVLTVTNNLINVVIEDTSVLPKISYFDIQTVSPEGVVATIIKGTIMSEQDVTRA